MRTQEGLCAISVVAVAWDAFLPLFRVQINFHLDCVPIPQVVKSKCHRHHVKLVESFMVEGYDLEDQYCDICEEKRDPKIMLIIVRNALIHLMVMLNVYSPRYGV